MKHMLRFTTILTLLLFFLAGHAWGQTLILSEDFETDGNGTRYIVTGGFSDGSGDYFVRTDGVNGAPSDLPNYSSSNNAFYFAGEDTEDSGNPNSTTSDVTFDDVDIQNYTDLSLKGLFACGGQAKFDPEDYMRIYIDIDNSGSWTLIGAFEADISSGFNSANFGLDSDLDGQADGPTYLTTSFLEYSFGIASTGNLLDVKIELFLTSGDEEAAFDYIRLEGTPVSSGPNDPQAFSASAASSSQIDLTFQTNTNGDNIIIVWDNDGTFSDPTGSPPAIGQVFAGGTLIYNGTGTSYNHSSLNSNTQYHYQAWSYDNTDYSTGLTDNATTLKAEPSNHVTSFTATANGHDQIDLTWTDAIGTNLPTGYLIKANTSGTFSDPVDGTDPAEDTDLSDGSALVKVAHGSKGSYSFSNLSGSTTYYFKIWPYSNSGTDIDFKTDGTVPTNDATTGEAPSIVAPTAGVVFISEVSDAASDFNTEFMELFNNSNNIIDLSNSKIIRYPSGGGTAGYVWDFATDGSGDTQIPANGIIVIARGATKSEFETEWGSLPAGVNYNEGNTLLYFGTGRQWALKDGGTSDTDDGTEIDATNQDVANGDRDYQYPTGTWNNDAEGNSNPGVIGSNEDPAAYLWDNGAGTSNWNDANNWNPNQVPGPGSNVTIDAIKTDIQIAPGESADCYDLTVDGTLTIKSDATGTGSLIIHGSASGSGTMTMERYIAGWTNNTPGESDGWHLLSSPVATFNIDASDFDPGSLDDFYGWSETTYEWLNHKAGDPTQVVPGFGYLVAFETTGTKNFTETFNNTDVTHSDLSYTPAEGNGWHLLGNPFQSALHWTISGSTWDPFNISAGAKILQDRTYVDIVAGGTNQYIPANQGFFVQVTDADNSINIPAAERVHNTTAFYKSQITNALELVATDGVNNTVRTWVQIMDGATPEFDDQFDMHFLGGMYLAPQLYSLVNSNERLSTNRIPMVQESATIQLGFKSYQNTEYTIHAEDVNTFDENLDIILEDTEENMQMNLRETTSYTFMATADELTERFRLHILKSTGIHEATIEGLSIYTHNNILYLNSTEVLDASVEVFNVTGQQVYRRQVVMDGLAQINPNLKTGWYVVKVTTSEGMASTKVFIK